MSFIDIRGGLNEGQVFEKLNAEIKCQKENGVQYWPIFEKKNRDFVGCCGLKPWIHSSRGGLELGFHLIKEKWGKGFAKEAAQGAIGYAFRELKVKLLMAGHHPKNENSKKILLQLGFQFVEDIHFKPTGLNHASYEMKASEYHL